MMGDTLAEESRTVARATSQDGLSDKKTSEEQVLRVWHLDDCLGSYDEKDLASGTDFTAFKCIRASPTTASKTVVESIGRKLLVADASLFRLYSINLQSMC
jgi:hypothetical protein